MTLSRLLADKYYFLPKFEFLPSPCVFQGGVLEHHLCDFCSQSGDLSFGERKNSIEMFKKDSKSAPMPLIYIIGCR